MKYPDVVVLVPGFLGFSRTGGFYYFADRVSAAVRGALESVKRRQIPVVPCSTLPTDHLAARQRALVASLKSLSDRIGGVERFHVVGHSAGGVDAQLLTCERPVDTELWSEEAASVRAKIHSVICVASPHHGTCLSNSPLAKLAAQPLHQLLTNPRGELAALPSIARQLWDLARLATWESDAQVASAFAARLPESSKFLWQMVTHRGLIEDLAPSSMEETRWHCGESKVFLRSFVTMTTPSPRADPFYQDLQALTADTAGAPPREGLKRALALLTERAPTAIRSGAAVPAFDAGTSDGVVNSARQFVDPSDSDELAGIVVGDHADVIGHYDRQDAFVDGKPLNNGLFHSGAGFGDDQFYTLYGRIAELVASKTT